MLPRAFCARSPLSPLAILGLGALFAACGGSGGESPDPDSAGPICEGGLSVRESEPNGSVGDAQPLGRFGPGSCIVLNGEIQTTGGMDDIDVFEFLPDQGVTLVVALEPDEELTDVGFFVTDASGDLIIPAVDDAGPGQREFTSLFIDPAEHAEFNLAVFATTAPATAWRMEVAGVAPPVDPQAGAAPPESPGGTVRREGEGPSFAEPARPQ